MQKINNNKGITLTTLAITIVVLLIIVGITVTGGINGGNTAKDNQAITDLEKVQHAVAQRYSKFKLTNDINLLVGTSVDLTSLTDVPTSINWKVRQFTDVSVENDRKYYRLSTQELKDLGFNGDTTNKSYIVNYFSGEVYDETQKQTSTRDILYKSAISTEESGHGDEIIRDGLQVWYDAENNTGNGHSSDTTTWFDLSGNGNNGTMINTTWGNNYAYFNGTSSWVKMFRFYPTNKVTVEAEFSLEQIKNGEADIICNYETGGLGLNVTDGKPHFSTYINGNYRKAILDENLDIKKHYHLVGTYDGTVLKLYVNGIEGASYSILGTIARSGRNTIWGIGSNPFGEVADTFYSSNIKMYSARIYNRPISEEEIYHNYILGKNKYGIEQ